MSWHKITLPLADPTLNIVDPVVVEIGRLGRIAYERENKPAGFAMFHATRGSESGKDDKFLVYLTPVASEICTEIAERYTLEPCGVPAYNEPNVAFVFGDPLMMGALKQVFEPEPGTVEWTQAEAARKEAEESRALGAAAEARAREAAAAREAARAETEAAHATGAETEGEPAEGDAAQADSAQA